MKVPILVSGRPYHAGTGPLEHLAITGRAAERGMRAVTDHEVNPLGLAGIVVVEQFDSLVGKGFRPCRPRISFHPQCRPRVPAECLHALGAV